MAVVAVVVEAAGTGGSMYRIPPPSPTDAVAGTDAKAEARGLGYNVTLTTLWSKCRTPPGLRSTSKRRGKSCKFCWVYDATERVQRMSVKMAATARKARMMPVRTESGTATLRATWLP